MHLDEVRLLIYKGISLGMLHRLHRHVKVLKCTSDNLEKINELRETQADEVCLSLGISESELMEQLSKEASDCYQTFYC